MKESKWNGRPVGALARMRKALVVQGSPTTTGGVVTGGSAVNMTDRGKPFALHGDEATCGKCKGSFKIAGTATRRCYRGQAGVIEGDRVLCPCGQNRVLASPNPGCFYEDESGAVNAVGATQSRNAPVSGASVASYDDRFILRNANEALTRAAYAVQRRDGTFEYGETDSNGHTHLLASTVSAERVNVYFAG